MYTYYNANKILIMHSDAIKLILAFKSYSRNLGYHTCNPEIEENEIDEEVLEQPKQKTPVVRPCGRSSLD